MKEYIAELRAAVPGTKEKKENFEAEPPERVTVRASSTADAKDKLKIHAKSFQRTRREMGDKGCLVRYVLLDQDEAGDADS